MQSVYDYLKPAIPSDHCHQTRAIDLVAKKLQSVRPRIIVDLGCGRGDSVEFFRKLAPEAKWIGVDIAESPEVLQRTRNDAEFVTYDGICLPFEHGSTDLIYTNQVFEHVRYPEALLKEICRVLASDGLAIGQTSQLEPYHSYSYWNFTVYGFKKICEDAGLGMLELRPGIDANTLFRRSYLGRPKEYSKWFKEESPLNVDIEREAKNQKRGAQTVNFRKLMLCGQFCFILGKLI